MFQLVPVPEGAERLVATGDWVEKGQFLVRARSGEYVAIEAGFFVQLTAGGPFGVVSGFVEEVGQDGAPVGRSFEVMAADYIDAEVVARVRATKAGMLVGRRLFAEQIEAGRFEVVFAALEYQPPFADALADLAHRYGVPVWIAAKGAPARSLTPSVDIGSVASIEVRLLEATR